MERFNRFLTNIRNNNQTQAQTYDIIEIRANDDLNCILINIFYSFLRFFFSVSIMDVMNAEHKSMIYCTFELCELTIQRKIKNNDFNTDFL